MPRELTLDDLTPPQMDLLHQAWTAARGRWGACIIGLTDAQYAELELIPGMTYKHAQQNYMVLDMRGCELGLEIQKIKRMMHDLVK